MLIQQMWSKVSVSLIKIVFFVYNFMQVRAFQRYISIKSVTIKSFYCMSQCQNSSNFERSKRKNTN